MFRSQVLVMVLLGACWGADVPLEEPAPDAEARTCELPSMSQTVATLSGCAERGTLDGVRGDARFNNPTNVVIAPTGVAYVTDFDSGRVRAIDLAGTTTTVYQADNFKNPFGIALAPGGKLYVETDDNDRGEHSGETGTIWLVDPIARTAQVIARDLGRPRGLAVLADGRIAMADHVHHTISLLEPDTGKTKLLAGTRDEAGYDDKHFAQPYDIVAMPDGALVVSDMDNHRLRRITLDGEVTDFAGSGEIGTLNGPCGVATLDAPQALAVTASGTLFVTDVKRKLVRRIENGTMMTIAGDGTPGWLDAHEPRNARFYGVEGIDTDGSRLLLADGNIGDGMAYNHVRVIQLSQLP